MNWYKQLKEASGELQPAVDALVAELKSTYEGLTLFVWDTVGGYLEVAEIEVPKEMRGQGIGTAVMNRLKEFAKEHGRSLVLRPAPMPRKKKALEKFYTDLGFVKNKGRKRRDEFSSPFSPTMYWSP